MKEIAIIQLDDLKELDDFIAATNDKAMTVKGLVVASDGDIKSISADIKELKQREDILKIAEGRLIKLAGIDRVGFTIENSREQRLLANKNVQNAKQEIKNKALDFFISSANELIKNSQASDTYKQTFDTKQIAQETISGKSKGFMDLMKTELGNLGLRLDNNARETIEKLVIINNFDDDMVRDSEYLLSLPVELLEQTLENRKREQDLKVKNEAQKLADAIEAERLEAERLAKIEVTRIADEKLSEKERLEQAEAEADRLMAETPPDLVPEVRNFLITVKVLRDSKPFKFTFKEVVGFKVISTMNRIIFYNSKNEILDSIDFKFEIENIKIN